MSEKVIVVGSGIAGIATSIRLAQKGYDVHVFESNAYPGGKLSAFKLGAYRFDAGPSLFTMPHFVEELFELCDEDPQMHFEYKKKKLDVIIFGKMAQDSKPMIIQKNSCLKLKML